MTKKQNNIYKVSLKHPNNSLQIKKEIQQIKKLKDGLTPFIYSRLNGLKQWTRDGGLFKLKLNINELD